MNNTEPTDGNRLLNNSQEVKLTLADLALLLNQARANGYRQGVNAVYMRLCAPYSPIAINNAAKAALAAAARAALAAVS